MHKTGIIQRTSIGNSPPLPRRNFVRFVRDAPGVLYIKEKVRKEANCKNISASLSKRRISCSAP